MYDIRSEAVPLEGSPGAARGPRPRRRRTPGADRVPRSRSASRSRWAARARGRRRHAVGGPRHTARGRTSVHRWTSRSRVPLSADLVARINAERAARARRRRSRSPSSRSTPACRRRPSRGRATSRRTNVVEDPPLPTCSGPGGSSPSPGQVCVFAANSGDSGYGFWPGDGSDGMDGRLHGLERPPPERARRRLHRRSGSG